MSTKSAFAPNERDLTLTLFKSPSLQYLTRGGEPRTLGASKALALLAYLVASPQHIAGRDHLLDLLWSDHEPDKAKHALRQAIWHLRRRLGDEAFTTGDRMVSLDIALATDVQEFEEAVGCGEYERAVTLYTGEFMPDIALPGGAEFERWADTERQRLRALFQRAAEVLARDRLAAGRFRDAEVLARRVRDADPLNEAGWRLVIEVLSSAGDAVRAAFEIDQLTVLLRDEGRDPEPATRAAFSRTSAGDDEAPISMSPTRLVTEMVGREREFGVLTQTWARVASGHGAHVHIQSDAGLGKTRLLRDFMYRLRASGATAVTVAAKCGERDLSYSLASQLADVLSRLPGARAVSPASGSTLVAVNPSMSSCYSGQPDNARGAEALRRRVVAVGELVAAVADEAPVAILIDDMHWADDASRQIVRSLCARAIADRVLIVTTARPALINGHTTPDSATLQLEPLSAEHAASLVASVASLPDTPWSERLPELLAEITGGSPLLILETLQLALERQWLTIDDAVWQCADHDRLFEALVRGGALRERLEDLGRSETWLMQLLATAGCPAELTDLAEASNAGEVPTREVLGQLEERGLVREEASGWALGHDEYARRTLEIATADSRAAAHRSIGRTLAAAGASVGKLRRAAYHLHAAGDRRALATVARRWFVIERRSGNHQSVTNLMAGLIDNSEHGPGSELKQEIPIPLRMRYSRGIRAATVICGLLATAGVVSALVPRQLAPKADAELVVWAADSSGRYGIDIVPLFRDDWRAGGPLELRPPPLQYDLERAALPAPGWSKGPATFRRSPDGTLWVYAGVTEDGGRDIHVVDESAVISRLTFSESDDAGPSWAPDGSMIAFNTARWKDEPGYDLAVVDVATKTVRPLFQADGHNTDPEWSPDGSRIAFQRLVRDSLTQICWVTVAGEGLSCVRTQHGAIRPRWYDPTTLIFVAYDSSGQHRIASADISTSEVVAMSHPLDGTVNEISSDGRWFVRMKRIVGQSNPVPHLSPTDRPELAKPVVPLGAAPDFWGVSLSRAAPPEYIDALQVTYPSREVPVSVPVGIRMTGLDQHGHVQPIHAPTVAVDDSSQAVVDADNRVRAFKPGRVRIIVSTGGWRPDTVLVNAVPPVTRRVVHDEWSEGLEPAWVSYGVPRPTISFGPDGLPALWNRGDGTFQSGVYWENLIPGEIGIVIDAAVSVPADSAYWQEQVIIIAPADSPVSWDHVTGLPPWMRSNENCIVRILRSDLGNEGRVSASLAGDDFGGTTTAELVSGAWQHVRVQLFPDGSCGVALNGEPIGRSTVSFDPESRFRIDLGGSSAGTKVLLGPLTIWEGVKTDIDWAALTPSDPR